MSSSFSTTMLEASDIVKPARLSQRSKQQFVNDRQEVPARQLGGIA
jgi:hypothetical protein